jgi:hypothetical protein
MRQDQAEYEPLNRAQRTPCLLQIAEVLLEVPGGAHDAAIDRRRVNRRDGQPHRHDSDNVSSSYHATSKTAGTPKKLASGNWLNKIKDYAKRQCVVIQQTFDQACEPVMPPWAQQVTRLNRIRKGIDLIQ